MGSKDRTLSLNEIDRKGQLLAESFTERRTVVPMARVPRVLVLSVLAAEDADFYHHAGMDLPSMLRVLWKAVIHGRATQGGSTITQQVVKNLLLTPEKTLERKLKELILARRLEQELSKDEILALYLNDINFGHGRYGVQEAARYYFDNDVEQLNLAEASLIAGIPQSPTRLSPRTHLDAARRRQMFVLDQLEAKRALYWDDLSVAEIEAARKAEPGLAPLPSSADRAPEVAQLVRQALVDAVGEQAAARGGYTVTTSIDLDLQEATRRAVWNGLHAIDVRQGKRAPLEGPRLGEKQLAQLTRGLIRERDRNHLPWASGIHRAQVLCAGAVLRLRIGQVFGQEQQIVLGRPVGRKFTFQSIAELENVDDAVDEHGRLAAACTRQDEQRTLGLVDSLALLVV